MQHLLCFGYEIVFVCFFYLQILLLKVFVQGILNCLTDIELITNKIELAIVASISGYVFHVLVLLIDNLFEIINETKSDASLGRVPQNYQG